MKKTLLSLLAVCFSAGIINAQVTAKDCTAAVNVCTNNSFSVSPAGAGFVDFTTSSNVSNPTNNPAGIVPPGGSGCLKSGELNPTWMIINIQTPGTLEFSMGAGTGPGAQAGCYDWIMWPYNPATTCSGINGNTQAPIRCCWNNHCSGGTGLASVANLPAGGFADDYGAPINVNCGDKFILCFSNYSSVNTLVPLNFFGTAVVSCTPLTNTLAINSASICAGAVATLSVPSSPGTTYTWQPGNVTGNTMTVSPSSTTIYTLSATNACGTLSGTTAVLVSAPMNITFSNTNGSCVPAALGSSTVTVTGGAPSYTYSWSPTGGTSNNASNLTTNIYTMTVTDAVGCKATATTSIFAPAPFSFSLSPSTGTILTCTQNSVTVNAVNTSTLSNPTYTWNPGNLTGNPINLTAPGVYTVIGQDQTVGSCVDTQTFAVSQNTAAPTITVSAPANNTLTCGSPCLTLTATTTGTTNITGVWLDANNAVQSGPSSTPLLMCAAAPGVYTAVFTNAVTGCISSQTVAVFANISVPTMTVNSLNGFTLTCAQPSLGMNITTNSAISPKTYSWTNVTTSITTTPANGGYTVTAPGQYVACLNANNCVVCQTITVMRDTIRPIVTATTNLPGSSYTLTCANPTLIATAITSPMLPITSYSWVTPPNLTVSQNTVSISLSNITSSTTPTSYTVLAIGANGCVGRQKVNVYKDIFVPPYTAVFTPSAITCANQCVALSTGASTSTVPITFTFTSPAPTKTATTNGFLFCQPGTYTMTYQSTLNGCTATTTTLVPLNVTPPATVALQTATINCGAPTTTITAGTTTTSSTYSYTWSGPLNSGMSCPGGVGCYSTTTNMPGTYFVTILNTVNGCRSTNQVNVVGGSLDVGLSANPSNGFAPLPVTFANNTPSTSTQGTVTTVWSYGNGLTASTTSAASTYSGSAYPFPGGSTVYNAPGTYTVLLMVTQISATTTCSGTATTVVTVDLPSSLTVPNVFTPNGDGVNDFFTLRTTNISEVTCTIFDRWGVKMYDVKSETGNISWDGKNLSGKEVPAGTYFYILKSTGKDGKTEWTDSSGNTVEQQGTISLYR